MRLAALLSPVLISCWASSASAHATSAHDHAGTWGWEALTEWTWDPATVLPLVIGACWYALGVWRNTAEWGRSRIEVSRIAAFAGGMLTLVLALQSPIDSISEDLFSVHMVQHLLLMLAAPPLLIWSDPGMTFLRALPRGVRKRSARTLVWSGSTRAFNSCMHPIAIWFAFCGAFVFWHSPAPYQWALTSKSIHIVEHLCFFVTSLAFWSIVLQPHGRRRLAHGPTLLLIVATAVLSGLPGALMIFSPRPLYPGHAHGVAKWGMTLIEDQQLAGLIMWIPAGGAYVLAASLVFLGWLREAEKCALAAARRAAPLTAAVLALVLAGCTRDDDSVTSLGDSKRGAALVRQYGCGGCHLIPGMPEASGNIGPPLLHVGTRTYIAGLLRNSPENLSLWVREPQKVVPGNAMPDLGMPPNDARDIAAFLLSLK